MKKLNLLALALVFAFGLLTGKALAYDCSDCTDPSKACVWWDVETYDGNPDISHTLQPTQTVYVKLYLSNVSSPGAQMWQAQITFDAGQFEYNGSSSPSMDVDDDNWPFMQLEQYVGLGHIKLGGSIDFTQTPHVPPAHTNDDILLATLDFKCIGCPISYPCSETFDFQGGSEQFVVYDDDSNLISVDLTCKALTITNEEAGNQPPECQDQDVITTKETPVDITLVAIDDGLPDPPSLTYSILSLPSDGSLKDKDGYVIIVGDLPYDLPDDNDTVTYTPDDEYCGDDNITFQASDGLLSCDTPGTVNIKVQCAVQMVMPRLWPCTPPYHWWFENPDGDSANPTMTATPNEKVCFYINYDAFDNDGYRERELSGIGFWVNYDPTHLGTPDVKTDIMHIFPKGYVNVLEPPIIVEDDDTHHRFLMAWADAMSPPAWPNEPLPIEIFKVCFVVPDDALEGITEATTEVTFTEADTAIGYEFLSESMTVKIVHFDIDIDKNGVVKPLTDGLLITRYLFGFMGNNLVSGAVDPLGARLDASLIADWIERGRVEPSTTNAGYTHLDIDANREVTPLTDGIMILRHLFGYTGINLTSGAIGPNATQNYDLQPPILEPDLDIGAYINTLNPL
jgi:hypothetical protein